MVTLLLETDTLDEIFEASLSSILRAIVIEAADDRLLHADPAGTAFSRRVAR
jgi:hypothetical protein